MVRKRLESHGWTVWRGGCLNLLDRMDLYPNVRKKYTLLNDLLMRHHEDTLDHLRYLCAVHHGMPDFICHRSGEFKFVESKYLHEQLSPAQKRCIPILVSLGFKVEIHRVVRQNQKSRKALLDIDTWKKESLEDQKKIQSFNTRYKKVKNPKPLVEPLIHHERNSLTTLEVGKRL